MKKRHRHRRRMEHRNRAFTAGRFNARHVRQGKEEKLRLNSFIDDYAATFLIFLTCDRDVLYLVLREPGLLVHLYT
jgi:hypothetical protein